MNSLDKALEEAKAIGAGEMPTTIQLAGWPERSYPPDMVWKAVAKEIHDWMHWQGSSELLKVATGRCPRCERPNMRTYTFKEITSCKQCFRPEEGGPKR